MFVEGRLGGVTHCRKLVQNRRRYAGEEVWDEEKESDLTRSIMVDVRCNGHER